jgi:hypothetical protein
MTTEQLHKAIFFGAVLFMAGLLNCFATGWAISVSLKFLGMLGMREKMASSWFLAPRVVKVEGVVAMVIAVAIFVFSMTYRA